MPKINRAVDRGAEIAVVKSLESIVDRAKTVYQRRPDTSRPGQSPSIHSTNSRRSLLNMDIHYDRQTQTGIAGPVKIPSRSLIVGDKPAPGLLELGGVITIPEESWDGRRWTQQRRRRRVHPSKKTRNRRVRVRPRPAMKPSLEMEIKAGNVLSPWVNVVRG